MTPFSQKLISGSCTRLLSPGPARSPLGGSLAAAHLASRASRAAKLLGNTRQVRRVLNSADGVLSGAGGRQSSQRFAKVLQEAVQSGGVQGGSGARVTGDVVTEAATKGLGNFTRALKASDLGIKTGLDTLKGTIKLSDELLTVRIDMIEGILANPFKIINHVKARATALGAKTVRFEGTLANPRLLEVLSKRFKIISSGGDEFFEILVK